MRPWRLLKVLSVSLICVAPLACSIDIDINTGAPTTSSVSVESKSADARMVKVSGFAIQEQDGQDVFQGTWEGSLDLGSASLVVSIDAEACGSAFQIHSSGDELERNSAKVPAEVSIVRAAGVLTLVRDAKDHGVANFRPSEDFVIAYDEAFGKESTPCEALGAFTHRIEPSELFSDGTLSEPPTFDDLIRLRSNGVDAKLTKDYAESFKKLDTEGIIALKRNGVPPEFVKGAVSARNEIEVADMIALRRNGVPVDFIREVDSTGHTFPPKELIDLRRNGVSSDFVKGIVSDRDGIKVDDVIALRRNGVPVEFIRELDTTGYTFTPKELIDLRRNGVPADFVGEVSGACEDCGTLDGLIQLRRNGIPAEFASSAKEYGYDFDVKDLVNLRRNGVTSDYLRGIVVDGMEAMDADSIVEVRRRGLPAETVRSIRGK